jgi:phenylpropionate dioxygenase-like ring-hydroxylating dioxygenase large terminal subunit
MYDPPTDSALDATMNAPNRAETEGMFRWPDEGLARVPFRVYNDPEIARSEQRLLFQGETWNLVGLDVEIPEPGQYRTNWVGDTPVIMVRDAAGAIRVFVNRCIHRGSMLCLEPGGRLENFTCMYHNWVYSLDGKLQSVAFKRGVRGEGGMPESFDIASKGLKELRVDTIRNLVFATFSDKLPSAADWFGPRMVWSLERFFHKPIKLIGGYTQVLPNNWKLYAENVRDSYHASLLHTFFATFGLNRLSMDGAVEVNEAGGSHLSWAKMATDDAEGTDYANGGLRSMRDLAIEDRRILKVWPEFEDGITHMIQTLFPNVFLQQIQNTLAVRLLVPRGLDRCDLQWWVFCYEDDTPEQMRMRLMQSNLVGPAGLVSLEDGFIGNAVQRTTKGDQGVGAIVEMGGHDVGPARQTRVSEGAVRGFWKQWRGLLGY